MLQFRQATDPDIPTLRELAQKIWRACYPPIIGTAQVEYMLAMMYSAEVIRQEMQDGVRWELAVFGEIPAGFLSITPDPGSRAKLNKLYLDPELHGRGLGQELIARACSTAAELGANQLWLQVNKRNERAIRAYERADFRVEREAVFDIGNGFVMDDFVMVRSLSRPERQDAARGY